MQIDVELCKTEFIKQLKCVFRLYYRGQSKKMEAKGHKFFKKSFRIMPKLYTKCMLLNWLVKLKTDCDFTQFNYTNAYCMLLKYTNGLIDNIQRCLVAPMNKLFSTYMPRLSLGLPSI